MEPDLPRIFAIDVSGSTSKCVFYHKKVQEILGRLFRPGDKIIIWSSHRKEISFQKMKDINTRYIGAGGTNTVLISEALNEMKSVPHLVIITDGKVNPTKVDICDEFNEQHNIKPELVTVYIIGKPSDVNYTVSAPFTRECPYSTYYINPLSEIENKEYEVTEEDIESFRKIDSISTYEEFIENSDKIENVIISKTIAKTRDIKLIDKMIQMRNRISNEIASKSTFNPDELVCQAKISSPEAHLRALECIKTLFDNYEAPPEDFTIKFNAMLRMANGGLRTALNKEGINSARIRLAQITEFVDVCAIEDTPETAVTARFECPISYEEENDPCILIAAPEFALLRHIGKKELDAVANNPLNAFHIPKLIDLIVDHIDHAISLKSMYEAQSLGMPITKSPITRKEIIGALALGRSKEHVKATDFALTQLLSSGRVIGSTDMWFALVWLLIKEGRLPFLEEVEPFVLEHLAFRISTQHVPTAMTGLIELPQTRITEEAACFACLCCIETKCTAAKAVFRFHLSHTDQLVAITEAVGFFISQDTKRHIEWTRALLMLNDYAKMHRTTYKNDFRALVQAFEEVEIPEDSYFARRLRATRFSIPIDGAPDKIKANSVLLKFPAAIRTVDRELLYWLSQFVDPNKPAMEIDYGDNTFEPYAVAAEWPHYDGTEDAFSEVIPICPITMRPFTRVDHKPYKEKLSSIIGVHQQPEIISCNNEYGILVGRMHGYPTAEELMVAVYTRVCAPGKHTTLPRAIREFCEETVRDYSLVIGGVPWTKFVKRFRNSASLNMRKAMEMSG